MRILAIDTATRATAVAVCDGPADGPALEARDDPPPGQRPRHVTRLMGLIDSLLERQGMGWSDIDRIAVGRGPGTFTGLRIGIATARALARSLERPLVGVSTLQSLALNFTRWEAGSSIPHLPDVVVAALDARRGEAFAAAWRIETDVGSTSRLGERLLAPVAIAPEELGKQLLRLGRSPLVLGEGAIEFQGILERMGALIPRDAPELHRVTAINHCRLAAGLEGAAPDDIRPDYLRLPDAEIARRAK